jgi:hypothetical protein
MGEILRKFRKLRKKKVELGTLVWTAEPRRLLNLFSDPRSGHAADATK